MSKAEAAELTASIYARAGLVKFTPTEGDICTVQKALGNGWGPNTLLQFGQDATGPSVGNPKSWLRQTLSTKANSKPTHPDAEPRGPHRPSADQTSPPAGHQLTANEGFDDPETVHAGLAAARESLEPTKPDPASDLAYCRQMAANPRSHIDREYWERATDRAQQRTNRQTPSTQRQT